MAYGIIDKTILAEGTTWFRNKPSSGEPRITPFRGIFDGEIENSRIKTQLNLLEGNTVSKLENEVKARLDRYLTEIKESGFSLSQLSPEVLESLTDLGLLKDWEIRELQNRENNEPEYHLEVDAGAETENRANN